MIPFLQICRPISIDYLYFPQNVAQLLLSSASTEPEQMSGDCGDQPESKDDCQDKKGPTTERMDTTWDQATHALVRIRERCDDVTSASVTKDSPPPLLTTASSRSLSRRYHNAP